MSKKDRDLPKPKKTPFGRKRNEDVGQDDLLMADKMALAAAEGKLGEYLEQELPEGEYAKKLAMMMMSMTGASLPLQGAMPGTSEKSAEPERPKEAADTPSVPEDVVNAVQAGDVEVLKGLLAREAERRNPLSAEEHPKEQTAPQGLESGGILEKGILDELIRVSSENSLTLDWLIARALKLYVDEYRKTGRL